MSIKNLITVVIIFSFLSCSSKKDKLPFYDSEYSDSVLLEDSNCDTIHKNEKAELIKVPFREEGGIKYVKVSVNGLGFEMIFDTGCSSTLISIAEANYLYEKGLLNTDDYLGNVNTQIADGTIVENMVFNLKEVIIDGKIICTDVTATVSANSNSPLLLGNDVLNRASSYTLDNENKTINFTLKKNEF